MTWVEKNRSKLYVRLEPGVTLLNTEQHICWTQRPKNQVGKMRFAPLRFAD
jgi:hypothetical protein